MGTAFFSRRKFGGKRQAANKGFTAKYAENYLSVYDIDLEVVIGPVDCGKPLLSIEPTEKACPHPIVYLFRPFPQAFVEKKNIHIKEYTFSHFAVELWIGCRRKQSV